MPPYITQFLLDHQGEIRTASLTASELVIEFEEAVDPEQVLRLFTDLITFTHPDVATLFDHRNVRLIF